MSFIFWLKSHYCHVMVQFQTETVEKLLPDGAFKEAPISDSQLHSQ